MSQLCPCGSTLEYNQCCGAFHNGERVPDNPAQLMRSRYSAFVVKNASWLVATWHSSCNAAGFIDNIKTSFGTTQWLGLTIYEEQPGSHTGEGFVSFIARFQENGKTSVIIERSRFLKENDRWFYIDGTRPSFARNDPCPCGSGKKFKKCCGQ